MLSMSVFYVTLGCSLSPRFLAARAAYQPQLALRNSTPARTDAVPGTRASVVVADGDLDLGLLFLLIGEVVLQLVAVELLHLAGLRISLHAAQSALVSSDLEAHGEVRHSRNGGRRVLAGQVNIEGVARLGVRGRLLQLLGLRRQVNRNRAVAWTTGSAG